MIIESSAFLYRYEIKMNDKIIENKNVFISENSMNEYDNVLCKEYITELKNADMMI